MGISMGHILIVLLVVILLFGTSKLRNMGNDLGAAVKGFKDGIKGNEDKTSTPDKLSHEEHNLQANQQSVQDNTPHTH